MLISKCQPAFDELYKQLMEALVLRFPDCRAAAGIFIPDTDSSEIVIGAVLSQMCAENQEHVIEYARQCLNKPEELVHDQKGSACLDCLCPLPQTLHVVDVVPEFQRIRGSGVSLTRTNVGI